MTLKLTRPVSEILSVMLSICVILSFLVIWFTT